jgi:hypothetical protein
MSDPIGAAAATHGSRRDEQSRDRAVVVRHAEDGREPAGARVRKARRFGPRVPARGAG